MLASFSKRFAGKYFCGVEIGGQTAAVAITDKLGEFVYKQKGIPTRDPVTPLQAVDSITKAIKESKMDIEGIGIASFGPIELTKGCIGNTPKPLWARFPMVKAFQERFPGIPVSIETDVNAPAYSEYLKYKETHPDARSVAYVTVGTGVGVGVFADGKPFHGRMHPEVGHLYPVVHPKDANFKGSCPFHGRCTEGMISAVSIADRLDIFPGDVKNIPDDHYVWEVFSEYLGQLAASCTLTYSLDAFVIGGGIVTAKGREYLIDMVRNAATKYINGYVKMPDIIVPYYGMDAGLVGACAVAMNQEVFKLD